MEITVLSSSLVGTTAYPVEVRCSAYADAVGHDVRGLSPASAKECLVRVRSALTAAGEAHPASTRVEFEPPPVGAVQLDLAVALAVLASGGTVPAPSDLLVVGELGLDGSVRQVRGVLAATLRAKQLALRGVVVPAVSAWEALLVDGVTVYAVSHLAEAVAVLRGDGAAHEATRASHAQPRPAAASSAPDMVDVRGQDAAIDALARAVARGDDVLLSGPPGTGKTMLGRRVPSLLPEMSAAELLATTLVYSAVGLAWAPLGGRPFRAPHHTISLNALVGDVGTARRPGEVQLASHGVLYLDEVSEFAVNAIEALASALRRMGEARPRVVASTNPCPCGWRGSRVRSCTCSDAAVERHRARVQRMTAALGISVTVDVASLSLGELRGAEPGPSSAEIRAWILDDQRHAERSEPFVTPYGLTAEQIDAYQRGLPHQDPIQPESQARRDCFSAARAEGAVRFDARARIAQALNRAGSDA